jgi:ATP-dependent DNA helicase RecQ
VAADVSAADIPALDALKRWRLARARDDGVPAYVVFHDRTLTEIAERRPASLAALASIRGVGPAKLERYGPDVLGVVSGVAG